MISKLPLVTPKGVKSLLCYGVTGGPPIDLFNAYAPLIYECFYKAHRGGGDGAVRRRIVSECDPAKTMKIMTPMMTAWRGNLATSPPPIHRPPPSGTSAFPAPWAASRPAGRGTLG
ncbi:hypothetical protein E2C01_092463 [Portunus trituberculatus]|uniref:Uncharacterized protein n=1 Tax=Portunus trituberculatus TaxID=210409 RepID=A0A5B7JVJ0_PORTR|nr:hypothetical protein [Portunus trituberculatus]